MIQQTSIQAYQDIKNTSLNQRQIEVYNCINNSIYGLTNKLISKKIGKPINEITPRTNELVKMGLIKEGFKAVDKYSTKKAIWWETK